MTSKFVIDGVRQTRYTNEVLPGRLFLFNRDGLVWTCIEDENGDYWFPANLLITRAVISDGRMVETEEVEAVNFAWHLFSRR